MEIALRVHLVVWRISSNISGCTGQFRQIGKLVEKIIRVFDFSRWRPSAILDLFGAHLGIFITMQNLVMIDAVVYDNMNVSIFTTFGW